MRLGIFKDARYFQIIFQSIFLTYGVLYLHWNAEWWLYGTYFGISILTQLLCSIIFNQKPLILFSYGWMNKLLMSIPSAMISSFGLSLLLKTNHWYIAALAAF